MVTHTKTHSALLYHALRGALALVCLSIAMGNSWASMWLQWQSTSVSRALLTGEMPSEEVPVETELPAELNEPSEFTTHRGSETQRRRLIAGARGWLQVEPTYRRTHRLNLPMIDGIMVRLNGCGAALRC